jgi:condensin-2 complex subunit D3
MFDKCIQILKRSWPQESNLTQKRKKDHSKSSKDNYRKSRKRGKPPRKEDYQVRSGEDKETFPSWAWQCVPLS